MSRYIHPCWAPLGIEPTSDTRAIRSAYTAKLKGIDPETDPQAFIALRDAYEAARVQAQWVDLPDDDEEGWDEDQDWDDGSDAPDYAYSPITGAATPLATSAADDKYRALADFLLPGGVRRDVPLSEEVARELHSLFDAALTDPRMEQLAFQSDADRWFAEILARAWPASDAVLLRAAQHFGWDRGAEPGQYITPAVDFINARLRENGGYRSIAAQEPDASPIAAAWADTPDEEVPDAVPSSESRPEWQADPEPEGFKVREPVDGPRFEPTESIPLPGGGPDWKPAASPWGPASAEDADARARALATLLYANANGETYASAEQKGEMLGHLQAITADPRMQEIAFFADADRWFSELIARSIPFSDPLIMPATRFFGWTRSDGSITQSWAAGQITQRYAAIEFMDAVLKRDHPLNKAWRELTTPAGEGSRRGRANPREVARLLTTVRTHYPDLEGAFDFYRVGLWDGSVEGGGRGIATWVFAIIFALMVLGRIIGSGSGGSGNEAFGLSPPVQVVEQLQDESADIEWALRELLKGDIDLARITAASPALRKALGDSWRMAKSERVSRATFLDDVSVLIGQWYQVGRDKGDADLLTDVHRLSIEIAKILAKQDPERCVKFLRGGRATSALDPAPDALVARERALIVRTLLTTDGSSGAKAQKSVPVPGGVIDDAAKRAGRPVAQIEQAMRFEGAAARLCPSRIAFMEAVLALPPKQRMALMRIM